MNQTASYGPRERARAIGIDSLGDADLVALLLGTGTVNAPVQAVAGELVTSSGGLLGLARAGVGELAELPGLGFAKAARIAAAVELGKRCAWATLDASGMAMKGSDSVSAWARPRLAGLEHEELWVLAVDGRNHLRAARRVAVGGLHGMHVSARDPLRIALREGASAFVLVHNHPSGDPTPSLEDLEFTRAVLVGAEAIGTPLIDHVVIARDGHVSLLERGIVPL
ncbi:RadC family protein [Pendulispora albinea]|uniref:DNA repair protein RadC n=1 Tax=Pendulispora albinea TaxID=2741071 RepID=A0ABZ2LS52_9BACT